MRPYLAILKDSFREALASRVMLVTLIGIVAVLAILSPFGLDVGTARELRRSEITDPERILERLTDEAARAGTPIEHLWSMFSKERKEEIQRWIDPEESRNRGPDFREIRRIKRRIANRLNDLITDDDFYVAEVWADTDAGDEANDLLARSDRSTEDQQRINLLLTAAVFPRSIEIVDSHAFSLMYGTAVVQGPIPLTPSQFEPIFDQILIAVVSTFLGFFGVFGCLLVTAGLIPRTFEPGEISLLLSKPVRRGMLFIVKFFGGCVFTLLYSSVLVVGIWFLLGVRMDYWRHSLLWCIPVYVLLFMIYYAVSAVAGAIWRNSIVALSLVVVFWLVVTVVGVTQDALKANLITLRGIKDIVSVGDDVLTIDGEQNTWVWDESSTTWKEVFKSPPDGMGGLARLLFGNNNRFLPVYDSTENRILAVQQTPSRFGGTGTSTLIAGSAEDDWDRIPLGELPDFAPTVLVGNDGRIILPSRRKIYRFNGQSDLARKQSDFLSRFSGGLLGGNNEAFEDIQPDGIPDRSEQFAAAIDPASNNIWLMSEGTLQRLDANDDGSYAAGNDRDFEDDSSGMLAVAGDFVIVAQESGAVSVLNATTLETVTSAQLDNQVEPRSCVAAADGSLLAVTTTVDTAVIFHAAAGSLSPLLTAGSTTCSAIAFSDNGKLLTADGRLAVRSFASADSLDQSEQTWAEPTSWVYQMYDYGILPAWTVLPKPSQLDNCVRYVMDQQTVSLLPGRRNRGSRGDDDDSELADDFDPWQVLRDNTIFVCVMLAFGCVYISRRDF